MAAPQSSLPFRERTRATKYQQKLPMPPNFAAILKNYTREVLREQPEDLLSWSAEYFKALAIATDPMQAQQPPPEHYAPSVQHPDVEMVSNKIAKVLSTMDDSQTGFLYVHLVKRALVEAFKLTTAQVLYILSSDYVNVRDDGTMEYRQFARDAVQPILYFQHTKQDFPDVPHVDDADVVHGMVREELQDELLRVMRQVDREGLGRLTYAQYRDALEKAPLQLTRRDIDVLCAMAEQTSDGYIDFRLEVENAFGFLYVAQSFTAFDEQQVA
jgi:hypothetical protein